MKTPQAPYRVVPSTIEETEVFHVFDATDQLVATSFDADHAKLISAKLNPYSEKSYVSSMLCAWRLMVEHELRRSVAGVEFDLTMALDDLCAWFGLHTGQRALVLGPIGAAYVDRGARMDGEAVRIIEVQYA